MATTFIRDNYAYGHTTHGNYWTTHHFGFNGSSFKNNMVPEGRVPVNRASTPLEPKIGREPSKIIILGELRSTTHNRWLGGAGQEVRYHPTNAMNIATMDGAARSVSGPWSDSGFKFFE